ncbi:MAG TPA: L-seryl-tRNA(Sec) selenium transferase [Bacillota bacterium]|nr:L-seryl-tRNA(Sec) selenium transferase [Bacillota bacterium]HOP68495.1 L-seryl-tRNA(Sec) selenium transferase [Bacillota bacterium]HPT33276.1 L-seryl-tRNA(Sec) selenium transferase [Bacillota bacterium]HPZ64779.1 L-seryl-tRNA(Sec) selenium transferase [Bacillota bacterium]
MTPVAEVRDLLRELPAVDRLLREPALQELEGALPRQALLEAARQTVESYRSLLLSPRLPEDLAKLDLSPGKLAAEAARRARRQAEFSLRPVINATGVILHTNLGRAPLSGAAVEALTRAAGGYCNLEMDLESGERGSRQAHLESLLCRLTGAEAALVVNNNAAAVFLSLHALAFGKEVIVSRGQLVEIGGSFRLPEVMAASGARMVEVGTTNKCHRRDYEEAITEATAALLKVHTSNYQIVGFTSSLSTAELVSVARAHGLLVIEDLGSGVLLDLSPFGIDSEPRVQDSIAAGADLVTFSGDKLLGGPQAGIIVGRRALVERIRSNQLARIVRVDKLTVAALEATLRLYLEPEKALRELPVWSAFCADPGTLKRRAASLARRLKKVLPGDEIEVIPGVSRAGGGSLPLVELPTFLVAIKPHRISAGALAEMLRRGEPPVIARISQDCLCLDLRTVPESREKCLLEALSRAAR